MNKIILQISITIPQLKTKNYSFQVTGVNLMVDGLLKATQPTLKTWA